jgi:peptidoglycan-associated lipoprotein
MKFVLVFALAFGLFACSKNVKEAPKADAMASAGSSDEIIADHVVIVEEDNNEDVAIISETIVSLEPVYFALNQYTLNKDTRAVLDKNVNILKTNGAKNITVEGNCDEKGTISYNIALGDKRAKEVKDYYVKRGIPADNITTVSYGEERPVCFEQAESCWSKNRRSDTLIR